MVPCSDSFAIDTRQMMGLREALQGAKPSNSQKDVIFHEGIPIIVHALFYYHSFVTAM